MGLRHRPCLAHCGQEAYLRYFEKECTSVGEMTLPETGLDFTMPYCLGYSGLDDTLLQKYIRDSAPLWEGKTSNTARTTILSLTRSSSAAISRADRPCSRSRTA